MAGTEKLNGSLEVSGTIKTNNKTVATTDVVPVVSSTGVTLGTTTYNAADKLSKTEHTGVVVAGATKATTVLGGNTLVAPNGLVMSGTAASAGLVTRGICGVSSPDATGACSKDNLYINYDSVDTFNTSRQLILQAGTAGTHLGNNLYQYAVPRGEIVKNWVESKGYATASTETLGAVTARGNILNNDIDFNNKDFFNAGTRVTTYNYSTSQTPNTQWYWFKILPPATECTDVYYLVAEGDVNYPINRGIYVLTISNYANGTSYNVSLNCLGTNLSTDTSHFMYCAVDLQGNTYIQVGATWTSFLRFIHARGATAQTYQSVGKAALGTVAGFEAAKMVIDTGAIRLYNGAANSYGLTTVLADRFIGKATSAAIADNATKLNGQAASYYQTALSASSTVTVGTLTANAIKTGSGATNYFQSQKFRGEGDASTYYHAIDFGYASHERVDFYESGGIWNFWKNTSQTATSDTANLALQINLTSLKNKTNTFTWPSSSGTIATREWCNENKSSATNLVNGEIDLSLKTKDAKYTTLVTKLVELTGKTEAEVKAFLALIGITADVVNTNYGIAAQTFGINNTNYALGALISGVNNTIGDTSDPTIGLLSTAFGTQNIIKGQSNIAVGDTNTITRSNGSGAFGYANLIDSCDDSITLTNAFALGNHLVNNYSYSTAVGKYNLRYEDGKEQKLFQVGNGTADDARSNAFEVYQDGSAKVGKAIDTETDLTVATKGYVDSKTPVLSTTYSALKALRNSAKLVSGQQYRITDYQCTTTQLDTQSANHQFDIIVIADDVNKLNENARAIKHSGDTYFTNAGSKLESWELKYCLDNDTSRFAWANTSTGKGVIYWMKDEFNNECPYDFKNIQFKRIVTSIDQEYESLYEESIFNLYCYWATSEYTPTGLVLGSTSDFIWAYTFYDTINGTDASLLSSEDYDETNYNSACVHNNTIKEYKVVQFIEEETAEHPISLNNIVMYYRVYDDEIVGDGIYGNIFEVGCNTMTFSKRCYSNTFGNDCYRNTFGNNCYNNTFGNGCYSNTFGNDCDSNTFGNGCYFNTFGNYCYYNTFGNYCGGNTFGNYCGGNTFGDFCDSNTFGNNCNDNTFGNYCGYNTFGNNCDSNTFGNNCHYNTFGNSCYSNTFGNYCSSNTLVASGNINYAQYNIFENGVDYVDLQASTSGSSRSYLQNIKIRQGVKGTSSTHKVITETRNLTHDVTYRAIGAEDKAI